MVCLRASACVHPSVCVSLCLPVCMLTLLCSIPSCFVYLCYLPVSPPFLTVELNLFVVSLLCKVLPQIYWSCDLVMYPRSSRSCGSTRSTGRLWCSRFTWSPGSCWSSRYVTKILSSNRNVSESHVAILVSLTVILFVMQCTVEIVSMFFPSVCHKREFCRCGQ